MHRIMLLDDEPNILSALRRCIVSGRRTDEERPIVVECFTSAEKALQRLEEQDFDLVLSDFRMPGMDGVEFLLRAIEINPASRRLLMSAHADRAAIVAAINEARIVRFVDKPWDDDAMRALIDDVLRSRRKGDSSPSVAETRLEAECPGITRVERAEDGGIILEGVES